MGSRGRKQPEEDERRSRQGEAEWSGQRQGPAAPPGRQDPVPQRYGGPPYPAADGRPVPGAQYGGESPDTLPYGLGSLGAATDPGGGTGAYRAEPGGGTGRQAAAPAGQGADGLRRAAYAANAHADHHGQRDPAVSGGAEPPADRPLGGRAQRRRAAKRAKRRRRLRATREVPILVVTALLIALALKTFLIQAFSIPSGSMENTIRVGDRVVVDKLTPWFGSKPSRGDVVVFKDPGGWLDGEPSPKEDPPGLKQTKAFFTFIGLLPSSSEKDLIKRVVAVGGDTVVCCDRQGRVMVNDHPLQEPYLRPGGPPSTIKFKVQVPRGRLFVMGDNRSNSADSRFHLKEGYQGTVPEDLVVGRAFFIAWPTGHWRGLEEPSTFASVPSRAGATTAAGRANNPPGAYAPPIPVELPIVMSVVGMLPRRAVARFERARIRARGHRHSREE